MSNQGEGPAEGVGRAEEPDEVGSHVPPPAGDDDDDAWMHPDFDAVDEVESMAPYADQNPAVVNITGGAPANGKSSIFQAPKQHFPPFPQTVWRGLFHQYADAIAQTTEASEAALWGAHAAALSVIVGRDCWLDWGMHKMFPSLHVAILGPTGSGRKSSSIDDAQALLVDPFKPQATLPGEPDPLVVMNGMGSGEGFMEAIKDTHWLPPGAKRGTMANVQTGRRALFVIPELGGLMEKATAGAAGSMIDFVINAWDCKKEWTHQIRRTKDTAPFKATEATAVILAASTVDWLSEVLTVGHVRNGLVNRFLWIAGDPRDPVARRPSPDPVKVHTYQQSVAACLARVRHQPFSIDPVADQFHTSKYAEVYSQRRRASADDLTASATNRAEIQALRLAILLAVSDGTTIIDLDLMQAAWDVVEYSNKIVDLLTHDIAPKTLGDFERRVLKCARNASEAHNGAFTRRQVWERARGARGLPSEVFGKTWDGLVREGDIVQTAEKRSTRNTPYFKLARAALEALDPGGIVN